MLDEEKKDNLHEADGQNKETVEITNAEEQEEKVSDDNIENINQDQQDDEAIDEIDKSNAEDAEDEDNQQRHSIPMPDYHALSMEKLVAELQELINNHKIQAIKNHVDGIKYEFELKHQEELEQRKEDFINDGGNEIDFSFTSPTKKKYDELYSEYRAKRNAYYKNLEQTLKGNLEKRLHLIEELKGLINVDENINETFKRFKEIQDIWRHAGPVPRVSYNDVWRTYHFHVERFYDFLDLNRDLRDLDFKHNLEEKEKLVTKAEALKNEKDVVKAFRELQMLHKIWKEDIGPVDREHREDIWNRFSEATKEIHKRRQEYYKKLDELSELNLEKKRNIIAEIEAISSKNYKSHSEWQKKIKEIESLREAFFNAGKVPQKFNEETWSSFKETVRRFNRSKNAFYKTLKKEQHVNLEKKLKLVEIAQSLQESEDWNDTTPIMKKIQSDWKKIGHVPRKYSDKIWDEFKAACNKYFDRYHAHQNKANKVEFEALDKKKAFLDELKTFELGDDQEKDLKTIKNFIAEWNGFGKVPFNKRGVEAKFFKIIDALFRKLNIDKQEAELIKYGNKIDQLEQANDENLIYDEKRFIRRKIDELKGEIRQLENNLAFFNTDKKNPIVKDVVDNIDKHKQSLDIWKAKLKEIRNINLEEDVEEQNVEESSDKDPSGE
ncbi:protein of unknown function [Zhouia amylolytica]|uniref:Chromosome segregation protein n=2 Tax=Zhouia amylolytica TaxID=376730 RepID=W2URI5_9FLAO|nr:DUF349 domain-containing protein [Zhouia amylolytica]ETN96096.1 protein of unknown function (DUF349) [Zhouia amylolytica AD3]MCQ0111382.1 DUF349 domain-containing protein [Zhouia amylolytica]SFS49415.1 protein of unknown function [Zhouia amylolytica]